ncbi:MAG: hypothetical protein AB1630_00945 [bacterium]
MMMIYYEMIRGMSMKKIMKNKFDLRLKMVKMAEEMGIRQGARVFETTRKIIRKWLYRYKRERKGRKNKRYEGI